MYAIAPSYFPLRLATLAKRYAGSCDVPDKCTPLTEKEEDNLKRRQNECPETRQLFQPYFGPGSKITKLEESKPCDQSAKLKV